MAVPKRRVSHTRSAKRRTHYKITLKKPVKDSDGTYALLTSIQDDESLNKKWYYFFLLFLSQLYWLIGSTLGAIIGINIKFNTQGLEFSLTALFVVLCIEQYKNLQNIIPFVIALVSSIFTLIFIPSDKMLIVSIILSLVLMFTFKKRIENE